MLCTASRCYKYFDSANATSAGEDCVYDSTFRPQKRFPKARKLDSGHLVPYKLVYDIYIRGTPPRIAAVVQTHHVSYIYNIIIIIRMWCR